MDHFDLLAPLYDRLIRPPADSRLNQVAGLPTHGRLLDAGGGTGRIAERLREQVDQIVIADSSLKMLRQAIDKGGFDAVGSLTEKLPFSDGSFERIIVVDAYHHLTDQESSLVELWRVLAPGGRLVIEEPDIDRFAVKLIAIGEKLAFMRSHFVRAERIAARLAEMGADAAVERENHAAWVIADKI
ncbi:MAG: class I SAM-dependent methyltransferase [Anaerolineales bacterium]|nr:class I SAM-dependent methyltransferase [Anaerolineales bacterium]